MELLFHTRISLDRRKGRLLGEIWWDLMIKSTAVNAAAQSLSSNPHCILHVGVQTVTAFGAISLQTDEPSGPVFPYFGCNFFLPWSASNLAIFLSVRPSAVGRASHLSNLAPVTNGARKCPPRGGARSRWQLMSHQIPHTRILQVRCRKVSKGVSKRYRVTEHTPVRSSWFLACFGTGQNSCSQKLANCL